MTSHRTLLPFALLASGCTALDAYLPTVNVQSEQTWWQKMWHR